MKYDFSKGQAFPSLGTSLCRIWETHLFTRYNIIIVLFFHSLAQEVPNCRTQGPKIMKQQQILSVKF